MLIRVAHGLTGCGLCCPSARCACLVHLLLRPCTRPKHSAAATILCGGSVTSAGVTGGNEICSCTGRWCLSIADADTYTVQHCTHSLASDSLRLRDMVRLTWRGRVQMYAYLVICELLPPPRKPQQLRLIAASLPSGSCMTDCAAFSIVPGAVPCSSSDTEPHYLSPLSTALDSTLEMTQDWACRQGLYACLPVSKSFRLTSQRCSRCDALLADVQKSGRAWTSLVVSVVRSLCASMLVLT